MNYLMNLLLLGVKQQQNQINLLHMYDNTFKNCTNQLLTNQLIVSTQREFIKLLLANPSRKPVLIDYRDVSTCFSFV